MLLESIYEQDFKNSSYGFRPKRSAHQALAKIQKRLTLMGGGWVVEVDIEKYFDTIVHQHLREMLSQRVRDGVITRLIGKWLNAGVLEEGVLKKPEAGTPQGGVISPLLANIYLHEVVDVWFEKEVKPRMKGEAFLARYADDLVMGFANEEDARKVMEVLPKRFGKYGLSLHREKTRLVDFRSPGRMGQGMKGTGGSFDLLGFTHYWAKSRRGYWVVKQKTSKSRLARAEKKMNEWMRRNRHLPVKEQHAKLVQKLKGYCRYFGITGNKLAVSAPKWENGDGTMEEMVREKIPARIPYLGEVQSHAQKISSTGDESDSLGIRLVVKL
jgi:RNA-directed DNA polymerase